MITKFYVPTSRLEHFTAIVDDAVSWGQARWLKRPQQVEEAKLPDYKKGLAERQFLVEIDFFDDRSHFVNIGLVFLILDIVGILPAPDKDPFDKIRNPAFIAIAQMDPVRDAIHQRWEIGGDTARLLAKKIGIEFAPLLEDCISSKTPPDPQNYRRKLIGLIINMIDYICKGK